MASNATLTLSADEIDDLLYFTRANEADELDQALSELAKKNQCTTKDIVEAAIDPENGNTVLHYCSANGLIKLVQQFSTLLDPIAESKLINYQNKEGSTPLHWAAYNGHLDVVKFLIEAKADMWLKNAAGHLAMFEAERADKNEVVTYLLEAGGKEVERTGSEKPAGQEDEVDTEGDEEGFTMSMGDTSGPMEEA
ncbi:Hypothetical protein R9X50_00676000 [Acrodontium crateriforme]|uniref:Ankyrin n=1 Tax=Acrodontium crateriforme TaxID=150365 RepID=A0AAQ3MAE0_9PEZI|nr:Hypothetical protein R9X50_00676000 [Acrodontium crateriforme]